MARFGEFIDTSRRVKRHLDSYLAELVKSIENPDRYRDKGRPSFDRLVRELNDWIGELSSLTRQHDVLSKGLECGGDFYCKW